MPLISPAPPKVDRDLYETTLLMITRFKLPICKWAGARILAPRRMKMGVFVHSRMVTPVKVMSSNRPPSTDSSANPPERSKTQFEMVMFLNPALDSVPHLILPVRGSLESSGSLFHVPSSMDPSSDRKSTR